MVTVCIPTNYTDPCPGPRRWKLSKNNRSVVNTKVFTISDVFLVVDVYRWMFVVPDFLIHSSFFSFSTWTFALSFIFTEIQNTWITFKVYIFFFNKSLAWLLQDIPQPGKQFVHISVNFRSDTYNHTVSMTFFIYISLFLYLLFLGSISWAAIFYKCV